MKKYLIQISMFGKGKSDLRKISRLKQESYVAKEMKLMKPVI